MSGLRGSLNYIWDLKHPLGQGATSLVCPGRHKRTGEQFAVKVFNHAGNMRPSGVKNREFEVLRKLSHDNIVRMIASEEEQSATNQVIVMELCTGGSLYSILEEAKNAFGLEEEEFLLVLEHVASGMKHLREFGVIHRDIKPGNIMRYIAEDGRSIYKLTDFGAARELEEEGQFMSLYGTEEYLHPDMYERAVLRGQDYKVFGATVDLWSLGVTFYHVLTGQLPFRPFGGRRNRETMYHITTQKESGVISGVQPNEAGPIEWSRDLPNSCRVSLGLQLLVTPFLAGLLEADCRRTWQFDKFFIEAKKITSKKVIHMYCPSMWQLLRIYADPTDTLTKLQELVAQQTEFTASSQVLIYQSNLLSSVVDPSLTVTSYPKCMGRNTPIYVFTLENQEETLKFPNPHISNFPRFSTSMSLDNDYPLAKMCLGILHSIHREIKDAVLRQRLTHDAVVNYVNQLYHSLNHLRDYDFHLRNHCKETEKRKSDLTRSTEEKVKLVELFTLENSALSTALRKLSTEWQTDRHTLEEIETKMNHYLTDICSHTDNYTQHHLVDKQLMSSWKFKLGCVETDRCAPKIDIIVKTVTDIMERFRADKQRKVLPYNDEQIHKFEKNNLYTLTVKAKTTLVDHCISNSQDLFKNLCAWIRDANALRKESHKTEKQMEELIQLQEEFTMKLDQLTQHGKMSEVISEVLASQNSEQVDGILMSQRRPVDQRRQFTDRISLPLQGQPESFVDELIKDMDSLKVNTESVIRTVEQNNKTLQQRFKGRDLNGAIRRVPQLVSPSQRTDTEASRSLTDCKPSSRTTLAAEQGDADALRSFMQSGTDWDKGDNSGCSALHHAAKAGLASIVKMLLSSGSDVNKINNCGATPLHFGSRCGVAEVVVVLLGWGAKPGNVDNNGETALHWAVTKGDSVMFRILLDRSNGPVNSPDIYGDRLLHFAAHSGKPAILRQVLESFHAIDDTNFTGKTALHLAVINRRAEAAKILLEAGAGCNIRDISWFTPLHYATKIGHAPLVELLLQNNADIEAKTKDGRTPVLISAQNGYYHVFNLLVSHGATINVCDEKYRSTLHWGVRNSHMDLVIRILECRAAVNQVDRDGWTALHYAAKGDNCDLVKILLDNGADVAARDRTQSTPLHIAASNGQRVIIVALVEHGADVQAKDGQGRTPLHHAVASGNVDIVRFLLEKGADALVPDETGETAIITASLCQDQGLAHLLTGQMTSLGVSP